ncbi:MAG: TlpA disulfide reductase family protein [Bacillota bacterium]|nr:TlpA disulfide reductase family protein [Bacillota bacterium]
MNKPVRVLILALLIGMFAFFAFSLVSHSKHTDIGDKAYNFALPNLDGGTTKLSDYKGQMVIINVFATWCAPCRDEAPELSAFAKDYGDKYNLIMLNKGETKDDVKSFIKKYKSKATAYVFDYDAKITKIYNTTGQPETFVIDKNGMIREHYNGPLTENQLLSMVQKHDK